MPLPITSIPEQSQILRQLAKQIKSNAQKAITTMAAGPVSANVITEMFQHLGGLKANFFTPYAADLVLMAQVASDLRLLNAAAAVAEVNSIIDAIDDVLAWIFATFPKSPQTGHILKDTLNADGTISARAFTTAQTAGLRTELQKIVDAIGV